MDERQAAQIGAQIRQARKAREWTQEQLAEQAGVAKKTVTAMENGRNVRPGNLRAVLDALGIPPLSEQQSDQDEAAADIELLHTILAQWLRGQSADQRARSIRDIMRFVVTDR